LNDNLPLTILTEVWTTVKIHTS